MSEGQFAVYVCLTIGGLVWFVVDLIRMPGPKSPRRYESKSYPGAFWGAMVMMLGWIGVLKYFQ